VNTLISSMKIKIMLADTLSEPIVGLSYELSVIKAVFSFPGHHCDHDEGRVAQHTERSIGHQN
jgi:hypothetical protein